MLVKLYDIATRINCQCIHSLLSLGDPDLQIRGGGGGGGGGGGHPGPYPVSATVTIDKIESK